MLLPDSYLSAGSEVVYLAEGNANVVYKLLFPAQDGSLFDGNSDSTRRCSFVLRVRKDTSFGVPYQAVMKHYEVKVKPLFSESDLVNQCLVRIPIATIYALNDNLKDLESNGKRPISRHDTYLVTDDPHALLLEDMSSSNVSATARTIELKPKWLVQSPSAPTSSLRCRNCALHAMRRSDTSKAKSQSSRSTFTHPETCPLDLLSPSYPTLLAALAAHTSSVADAEQGSHGALLSGLATSLLNHPTLTRLRAAQARHAAVGLNDFLSGNYDPLGLTLRDCTLFIRVADFSSSTNDKKDRNDGISASKGDRMTVEIKLADLDEKSPTGGKLEKWAETERRLIEEGWYEGRDMDGWSSQIGGNGGVGDRGELRLCDLGWGWKENIVENDKGVAERLKGLEVRSLVEELV